MELRDFRIDCMVWCDWSCVFVHRGGLGFVLFVAVLSVVVQICIMTGMWSVFVVAMQQW